MVDQRINSHLSNKREKKRGGLQGSTFGKSSALIYWNNYHNDLFKKILINKNRIQSSSHVKNPMGNHHTTLTNFDNTFCEFLPGILPETFQLSHISLRKPPEHLSLLYSPGNYIIAYLSNICQQLCNCSHKLVLNGQVFYRGLECDCESAYVICSGQQGPFSGFIKNNYK